MLDPKISQVIKTYRELKSDLDTKKSEFKEFERVTKEKLERLSMWLRDKADELGVDSFSSSEYGTAYRSEKTYVRITDWDKFIKFVISTDNIQMLEKRLAKLATLDILKTENLNPEDIGVEKSTDVDFLIRKPNR